MSDIQKMKSSIFSITNTSHFMWMAINRCIDYTKATNGMKLIPENETSNFKKILEIPIKCVSDLQTIIKIELKEISKEICENIVTDKQWLQENILCLVSNAVRFSTGGVVTIEVTKLCENLLVESLDSNENSKQSIEYLKFEVEDNGIGLSETAMQSLPPV